MKKNSMMKAITLFLVIVLSLSGCSKDDSTSESGVSEASDGSTFQEMTLNLGHSGSTDHHYQISALKFAEIVYEKTGGAVTVNIFLSSQLGSGPDQLEAVKVGTQDLVITPDAFLANHDPIFNVLGMPFLFTTFEEVKKIPETEFAARLEERAKEDNFVILGWLSNGFRLMTTNVPIEKPDDLAGLKFRIGSNKLISEILTTLGTNPTPVSMSETYTALQTGTVDGQENPTTNILNNKLYEVQDYLAMTRHVYTTEPMVMNKDKFDQCSPELQQILLDAAKEVAMADIAMVEADESKELKELEGAGMTVTYPDTALFKTLLDPLYEKYAEEYGEEWIELIELIRSEL